MIINKTKSVKARELILASNPSLAWEMSRTRYNSNPLFNLRDIYLESVASFQGGLEVCGPCVAVPNSLVYTNKTKDSLSERFPSWQQQLYLGENITVLQRGLRVSKHKILLNQELIIPVYGNYAIAETPQDEVQSLRASLVNAVLDHFLHPKWAPCGPRFVIFDSQRERQFALDYLENKFRGNRK
jgi:hypothetical protein